MENFPGTLLISNNRRGNRFIDWCITPLRGITWSIFNPGVELSPVYRVEISALSVIQNSIKVKHAIT
jgi:hypothetical protein